MLPKLQSFLRGVGSALNLWPAPLSVVRIGYGICDRSVAQALRRDCLFVAMDVRRAVESERGVCDAALPLIITSMIKRERRLHKALFVVQDSYLRGLIQAVTTENASAAVLKIDLERVEELMSRREGFLDEFLNKGGET